MADSSTNRQAAPRQLPPIVVVDGEVSTQKLDALFGFGHEQNELDFKATLDLGKTGSQKEKLELVADIAAMAAGRGGYIAGGIREAVDHKGRRFEKVGLPAAHQKHFDISNLRQLIESYVDVRIDLRVNVVSSGTGGRGRFGLVCVMPAGQATAIMDQSGRR